MTRIEAAAKEAFDAYAAIELSGSLNWNDLSVEAQLNWQIVARAAIDGYERHWLLPSQ